MRWPHHAEVPPTMRRSRSAGGGLEYEGAATEVAEEAGFCSQRVAWAAVVRMRITCDHRDMASMIQIRNVPDELHRALKARAARSGMTLSDFLLAELRSLSVRPTM